MIKRKHPAQLTDEEQLALAKQSKCVFGTHPMTIAAITPQLTMTACVTVDGDKLMMHLLQQHYQQKDEFKLGVFEPVPGITVEYMDNDTIEE